MIVFVDAGEAGVSGQMGVHGAQNREMGIVIDYDTIPRRDAMPALPPARRKPRQDLRRKKRRYESGVFSMRRRQRQSGRLEQRPEQPRRHLLRQIGVVG
ncbi:hypothetical protein WJ972_29585 [Achromobacter insuavis]